MRELDALLLGFVEHAAAQLSDDEIAALERILELPDPVLHSYLLGRGAPADASAAALIDRIRTGVVAAP
jgi:succinate dehydrogenase flavin-adding protein (antitoxin of CptAB toxin-antitoxin module)